ncbi:hypothetical protein ABS755_12965 [Castellaniella sp. FW104-16D08]|uniref:hypothetical protein n=1 Tax=unclassified Castellaniella TaxID=2617606 RepID=UPI0033147A66
MKPSIRIIAAIVLALPLGFNTSAALAADTGHSHGPEVHGTLEMNHGQQWETDAPLRQGMGNLHKIVSNGLDGAHANTLQPDDYKNMSGKINQQFAYIVENCKLEPQADAQLHVLLAGMMQGVEVMEGKVSGSQPEQGLVKMAQSLNEYGKYFNHPNWQHFDVSH